MDKAEAVKSVERHSNVSEDSVWKRLFLRVFVECFELDECVEHYHDPATAAELLEPS